MITTINFNLCLFCVTCFNKGLILNVFCGVVLSDKSESLVFVLLFYCLIFT